MIIREKRFFGLCIIILNLRKFKCDLNFDSELWYKSDIKYEDQLGIQAEKSKLDDKFAERFNIRYASDFNVSQLGTQFTFNKFHRTTEIYSFMDYLQQEYSHLVDIFVIGKTWEGRAIRTMKISSKDPNNRAIWIDGGIHAREWISVSSVCFIMISLLKNWNHLNPIFRNVDYILTPILNPDGYEFSHGKYSRLWRKNRRQINFCFGVDLNRNFSYKWKHRHYTVHGDGGKSSCGEEFAGSSPLSEPETRAVTSYILENPDKFKGFVTFHSYGQSILYPYGYEPRVPKDVVKLNHVGKIASEKILNITGSEYDVRPGSMMMYSFPGNSMDWAYKVAEIPFSYLVELRNKSSFVLPPSEIIPAGKEAFIIVLTKKWKEREQRLIEENKKLDQDLANAPTQKLKVLQTKLNAANDMINKLNNNLKSATDEWNKRETKLKEECNHLKYQLQNIPKAIAPDVERIQEQLKDSQEMNLKLKLDFDSCKDKCSALETLCSDLKKIIMDEQIVDKLYANDNIPVTVKQFLSSSSSSVINTLSHVFGCLSKSSSRNRHSSQKEGYLKKDLFTTNESLMINDLSRSYEHNEIIKELIREKEQLKKENLDLKRQVKELEQIVRRRAHPNFSNVADIFKSNDTKQKEQENETVKNLKKELLEKQHVIIDLKNQLVESKAKYDQNLLNLQGKVVNIQEESFKLKEELDKKRTVTAHGPKYKRRGRTCDPPLPSTRNFRMELSVKEKEIQALNKQLDELKRANRKLIEEKSCRISYLSSKEQSADDISLLKKLPSEINSGINTPDKTAPSSVRNFSLELNNDDDKHLNNQNLKNVEDICLKSKYKTVAVGDEPKNNEINYENKLKNETEDYKVLAQKLNYLEEKHQNLQQITCDLISLFNMENIGKMNKEEPSRQPEEFAKLVMALKNFSK